MPEHFDRLESRTPSSRENTLFRDLRHVLGIAKPRIASLRTQLRGVDVAALTTRAELTKIPLMRRSDLLARQAEAPPFGGISAMRASALKQAFIGGDGLVSLEGQARDWWGMSRALVAAGLEKGTLVLNCFSYDLAPEAHMVASGAAALLCPIIPAGGSAIDRKLDVIVRMRPGFFCGSGEELKALLYAAIDRSLDTSCIKNALVTGTSVKGLRQEWRLRGLVARHAFMRPEFGVIAYETDEDELMTVGEGLIVEIVDPTSGLPVGPNESGELVVTRISGDCPLLRYATGYTASISTKPSSCGRTNMRITTPQHHAPGAGDLNGQGVHISHIYEIAQQFPTLGRMSLRMRRFRETDVVHLRVEHAHPEATLIEGLVKTLHLVTRLRGTVELVPLGTLSEDEPMIVDERHLN